MKSDRSVAVDPLQWEGLPVPLRESFYRHWQQFADQCPLEIMAQCQAPLARQENQQQLQTCWAGSHFAAELCSKQPAWLSALLTDDSLAQHKSLNDFQQELELLLIDAKEEEQLFSLLRQFRNKNMLRIIWRDFNRLSHTMQTTAELSYMAEVCIQQASDFLHRQLCEKHGVPRNEQGDPQHLLVIAMGKLGAYELNLSSDIDLIFAYPEEGTTDHRIEPISNHQFFVKLGQKLIQALDKMTVDGFVFRVDMALRPHGGSGPLVCSFETMENYYQEQGRSWERYAMIKSRIVAGREQDSMQLIDLLRPFTYRRYIDYSVIESLREMKALINREVKRRGYKNNIKLGSGGIREIEFIVQAIQLVRGGREVDFQQREILNVLPLLSQKSSLSEEDVEQLTKAYLFLRDTEHAIQGYRDEQSQLLPEVKGGQPDVDHLRIAFVMGFNDWESYTEALDEHRQTVARFFNELANFETGEEDTEHDDEAAQGRQWILSMEWLVSLWEAETVEEKQELLVAQVSDKPSMMESAKVLHEFQQCRAVCQLQGEGKDRLNVFMPRLLREIYVQPDKGSVNESNQHTAVENPAEVLRRITPLILAVLRRSAYLMLLNENPQAIRQLVILSAASPWIAEELSNHPVLLDELLDEHTLYQVPEKEALMDSLRQEVLRIPLSDLEGHMESLRYFKQAHRLRIAASEVTGRLPLMRVSDYLTYLAEVIVDHALTVAWHQMTERHGYPLKADGTDCDPCFIVVGYGKMGGYELSHNSDLDVVFIHGADPMGQTRHESNSIDNATFYARLGQRLIHILETRTHSGQLYEIDTKLRPSGASGMLVSSLDGFEKYQQSSAWTWEHQALVRARPVAGCETLASEFERIRAAILSSTRDEEKLKGEVLEMRDKMREHLASKKADSFNLKQDSGGIVDIEFIVQFAVLRWAQDHPALLRWPDNIRLLEELASERLMAPDDAQSLIEAYKELRCLGHQLALQQLGTTLAGDALMDPAMDALMNQRDKVIALWKGLFATDQV